MTETEADDGSEWGRESEAIERLPRGSDQDWEEMTRAELRGWIARRVGARDRVRTPLTITTLNSVHAYITGGFHIERRHINTPFSPGVADMRYQVAIVAGIVDDPVPIEEYERSFKVAELRQIAKRMVESGDQRDWTPGST